MVRSEGAAVDYGAMLISAEHAAVRSGRSTRVYLTSDATHAKEPVCREREETRNSIRATEAGPYGGRRGDILAQAAWSDLQTAQVGNAGLHQIQIHFDEIILDPSRFRRGKYFLPVESVFPNRHRFFRFR